MYLVDFLNRMINESNIPVLFYLTLKVFPIAWIVYLFFGVGSMSFWQALLIGLVLNILSLAFALSPLGETILRYQTGCKKIKRVEQINLIEPAFREVYGKAIKIAPSIPSDVQLFISSNENPNAFAIGRKTICITEGLLYMPEDQIKAVLAHEFWHLEHKDTDLILVVMVGNLIFTVFVLVIQAIIDVMIFILLSLGTILIGGSARTVVGVVAGVLKSLFVAITCVLVFLWTKLGFMFVSKSSKENEFYADKFSLNLGYGEELCEILDTVGEFSEKGLFAILQSIRPNKDDRIEKLQNLGCMYGNACGKNELIELET